MANTPTLQSLVAQGKLQQALEQLQTSHPAAAALLGDYHRGHQAYLLNTIDYDEWGRIQSKLSQAVLALATSPPPEPVQQAPMKEGVPPADSVSVPLAPKRKVFLSYAREDEVLKDQLNIFLAPLRRSGRIAVWHDREILPGQEWDAAIKEELAEADIILLLVSPYFLASDYIWQHEILQAMERHDRQEAMVVPVFLKPCDWQDMPFAKVQGLPRNATPVTQHDDPDVAFLEIVQGIRHLLAG